MRNAFVTASILLNVALFGAFLIAKLELWMRVGCRSSKGLMVCCCVRLLSMDVVHWKMFKAASVRKWQVELYLLQDSFDALEKPRGFARALRVHVEPPLPLSQMPGVLFFFNEDGCLME